MKSKPSEKSRYLFGTGSKTTPAEKIVDQIELGLRIEMSNGLFSELASLKYESLRELRDLFVASRKNTPSRSSKR